MQKIEEDKDTYYSTLYKLFQLLTAKQNFNNVDKEINLLKQAPGNDNEAGYSDLVSFIMRM